MADNEEQVIYSSGIPFKHILASQGLFLLLVNIVLSLFTLFVWLVLWMFLTWLASKQTRIHITSQRIEVVKGVLSRKQEGIEFYRAKDSSYSSGILQSVLGVGQVRVISSDATSPDISFPVSDPAPLREKIRNAIRDERQRMGTVARD